MRRLVSIFLLAALAVTLPFGRGQAEPAAAVAQVAIINMAFSPSTLTVAAGTTVTWVNRDGDAHSVESRDKGFTSSPLLNTGEKYSYTFTTPGTYAYYCGVHASMTGKVVVTEAKAN
jgi:plastocyanin